MRAVVVGGGFIGLEMAENLVHRGFDVTVIEMADQVLGPLDPEYGRLVADFLGLHGVHVVVGDGVAGFAQAEDESLVVSTQSGNSYPADLVILALGVRPDTTLAKMAGIEIGELGGIRVDEHMRTSDPDIFAVGDAVEVRDFVTGQWSLVALAGPANRQGRIAADVIAGRDSAFRGTQGTAIVELFGAAVAWTGANEKTLDRVGDRDYEKIYLYPNSHAGLLPGRQTDRDEGPLPQVRRTPARRPSRRRGRRRQADQHAGDGDPDGRHGVRPRGGRALLRAAVRQRQGPGQLRRHGRRRRAARRHAPRPLGRHQGRLPPRRPREGRSSPSSTCRTPSTSPSASCALASTSSRVIARSTSSAAPGQRAYYATRILLQNGFDARTVSGGMLSTHPAMPSRARREPPAGAVACTTEQTVLGEGARWDARRGELLRVDIVAGRVFRDRVDDDGSLVPVRTYDVPGTVGAITPDRTATTVGCSPPGGGSSTWPLTASLRPIAEVDAGRDPDERRRLRPAGPVLGRHPRRRPPRRRRRALPAGPRRTDRDGARATSRSPMGWAGAPTAPRCTSPTATRG